MRKIGSFLLIVVLVLGLTNVSFAKNQKARGRWQGAGIALGVITLLEAQRHHPGPGYVGRYPTLAGGNVVSAFNGLAYDLDVTARGNSVRLGPGGRADFPVFFDEATVFTAVVLDYGVAIGTVQQTFYTNGNPVVWHITYFNRFQK